MFSRKHKIQISSSFIPKTTFGAIYDHYEFSLPPTTRINLFVTQPYTTCPLIKLNEIGAHGETPNSQYILKS